ncbi:MAG: pentapeptide repeat-containing protein [Deltaproteobacteria bacterium]|nr:pentapeptide repeat-containing protein [Deltaproteobacteria bacterium]
MLQPGVGSHRLGGRVLEESEGKRGLAARLAAQREDPVADLGRSRVAKLANDLVGLADADSARGEAGASLSQRARGEDDSRGSDALPVDRGAAQVVVPPRIAGLDFDEIEIRVLEHDAQRASFVRASFARASFAGTSFAGASFARASFAGASFARASFAGASFARASFAGASFAGAIAPAPSADAGDGREAEARESLADRIHVADAERDVIEDRHDRLVSGRDTRSESPGRGRGASTARALPDGRSRPTAHGSCRFCA